MPLPELGIRFHCHSKLVFENSRKLQKTDSKGGFCVILRSEAPELIYDRELEARRYKMKVGEILSGDPEIVRPEANIVEAAGKMKTRDIGMLPVCNGDRLVGCITDRDVAIRCVAEGLDSQKTQVRAVMTPHLYYCFDDQDLDEAAKIMEEKQVRRLPVVNREKRLVGIISLGDLAVRSSERVLTEEVLEEVSGAT